ncbi:sugar ABC transporter ATP-binding protein [Labrys monachus]|uniref:ABC-type sugar transport system ATPase subunit n=1 Tax=Labrys monachus TaxID=217067 RepID=A0ABU0FDY5_9HYPH|nr:sugar ABC transporter ATP-binding protein [Labrys monachus]MDQ0392815.1 ABC-type sugar transport system ATPase subunit [Labrys monachus]
MSDSGKAMLLEAKDIAKSFGGVRALDDVTFEVAAGEVHGLLGANGAGKSTLINILAGAVRPDRGSLRVAGRDVATGSLAEARKAGLVVVHQELMLFPDRTVEENIFASVLPPGPFAFIGRQARRQKVEAAMHRLGAVVDIRSRLDDLPLSHRQLVEIARALCAGGTVLVLDEPTSSLTQPAAQGLFRAIRTIVAGDAGVVFVSHRLDEVFAITDRLTVLRDGRVEGRWLTGDADIPTITRAMVGPLADERPRAGAAAKTGAVAMELHGSAPGLPEFALSLREGEVVGLAGLEGSGVSTAMQMLGGIVPVTGTIEVKGRPVIFGHPSQAIAQSVVYMPPDRKKGGLWLERDAVANIGAAAVKRMGPLKWLRRRSLEKTAAGRMAQVGVRASALHEAVGRLSGGNQQRVLLGRSLEARPRILLLNDFTRGVDVKAKAVIHGLVRELADAGLAICLTSSDLEELLDVADRIVCMSAGRVVADRPSAAFDKLSLLALASAAPEHTPA